MWVREGGSLGFRFATLVSPHPELHRAQHDPKFSVVSVPPNGEADDRPVDIHIYANFHHGTISLPIITSNKVDNHGSSEHTEAEECHCHAN